MKAEDFTPPPSDAPVLNTMIEDALAHAPTEADRATILRAWIHLGAEYLALEVGRDACQSHLLRLSAFIRDARPTRPWKP